MLTQFSVPLQTHNSFGIVAKAHTLVRVAHEDDVLAVLADPVLAAQPKFVLGGGSNIVLTGDVKSLVLKTEVMGRRLVSESAKAWIVEAGAGENWHDVVAWTLEQGWPGLENLALIPCKTLVPMALNCKTASSRWTQSTYRPERPLP